MASEPQEEAGLQPSQEGGPEGKEEEEPRVRCPCGANEVGGTSCNVVYKV